MCINPERTCPGELSSLKNSRFSNIGEAPHGFVRKHSCRCNARARNFLDSTRVRGEATRDRVVKKRGERACEGAGRAMYVVEKTRDEESPSRGLRDEGTPPRARRARVGGVVPFHPFRRLGVGNWELLGWRPDARHPPPPYRCRFVNRRRDDSGEGKGVREEQARATYVTIKLRCAGERGSAGGRTRERGETKCANKANMRGSPARRATIFPRIPRNRWN